MFDKIIKLRDKGYIPDIIFDIGAHHGNWTKDCMKIYPKRKYILIEPINYIELNQLANIPNIKIFNEVLNNKTTEITWYEKKNTGDSMFKEKTHHFNDCDIITKQSITLNSLLESKPGILDDCSNIFIKIDCQGAEIPILQGASNILSKTNFILLEIPFFGQYNENVSGFLEHIQFMDSIGFIPYDIIDNHYINGYNMQIDMIFINKEHSFNKDVQERLLI
jgi:FkbM family methyltransferase